MFRKINNVFRPNQHQAHRSRHTRGGGGGGPRSEQEYHSACTVRLVRSTSMLVVGERSQTSGSTLKRSKSSVSVESTLYLYQRQEDRVWLYSQNQNCLEYLEALVALRRQYIQSLIGLKAQEAKEKATASNKKRSAPAPPRKEQRSRAPPPSPSTPSAPPVPTEEDTLQFFDAVIASCDDETPPKPYQDDGHADTDFVVASSSAEHDLHSNWMLRMPRATGEKSAASSSCAKNKPVSKKKSVSGSTSSRLRLQRNPIHLPKVVESAFQTMRLKPRLKKQ